MHVWKIVINEITKNTNLIRTRFSFFEQTSRKSRERILWNRWFIQVRSGLGARFYTHFWKRNKHIFSGIVSNPSSIRTQCSFVHAFKKTKTFSEIVTKSKFDQDSVCVFARTHTKNTFLKSLRNPSVIRIRCLFLYAVLENKQHTLFLKSLKNYVWSGLCDRSPICTMHFFGVRTTWIRRPTIVIGRRRRTNLPLQRCNDLAALATFLSWKCDNESRETSLTGTSKSRPRKLLVRK